MSATCSRLSWFTSGTHTDYYQASSSTKQTQGEIGNARHEVVNVDTISAFELGPQTGELHQEQMSR